MVSFRLPPASRMTCPAIHRSSFWMCSTAAMTKPPKNMKMTGSAKGAKAALVDSTPSPMAKSGIISEVTVMWKASVSHSTPTNTSSASPRFSTGENGSQRSSRKKRTRSAARISQPRRLATTASDTMKTPGGRRGRPEVCHAPPDRDFPEYAWPPSDRTPAHPPKRKDRQGRRGRAGPGWEGCRECRTISPWRCPSGADRCR